MELVALLDKAKLLTKSDAQTARYLGMPKQHLSNVRNGLRKLTPYQSAKLAELIGEPWHLATLERLAELAPCEEERQFWRRKSETLRGIAARVAMVVFLTIGAGFPCHAGNARVTSLSIDQTIYCAPILIAQLACGRCIAAQTSDSTLQLRAHALAYANDTTWSQRRSVSTLAMTAPTAAAASINRRR